MSQGARTGCLGLALLVLGAAPSLADRVPNQAVSRDSAGWPIGDLALVDHQGAPFSNENLRGRWTLLAIADSRCGDPCDRTLTALASVLRRIAGARVIETTQVLVVSLRAEDRAADMTRLLAPHDTQFIGAIGPPEGLAQLADDLGIPNSPAAGHRTAALGAPDHAGSVWLIGPDAVIRAEFLPPFDGPLLTAEYLKTRLRG
ncbi:MAG: SCO family protein [Chromatiaceae bacterium]